MSDPWDAAINRVVGLTRQQIAETAVREDRKIMSDPPIPITRVRHVDGVLGAPETAVKDGGVIVYDYGRLDLVVEFALDTLRQLSPVDEGDYVRSHVIMINGVVVPDMKGWKAGDRVTISNSMPYTRKIEIGRGRYRARGHVYEKAERIVLRRFGNMANVWFIFDKAPAGDIHSWAKTTTLSHRGHASTNTRQEWLTRQPTLLIKERT